MIQGRVTAHRIILASLVGWILTTPPCGLVRADPPVPPEEARRPESDAELRFWLTNMLVDHAYSTEEASQATGLSAAEIDAAVSRLGIDRALERSSLTVGTTLRVLPYPGGRHPRIGFLDGALNPQRETKISVFTPWEPRSYVVVDVPEAIWSNLGLTYLAHTHVPTVWTKQGVRLARQEWSRREGGVLESERTLPNGIRFRTRVEPRRDSVRMTLTLANGTSKTLRDLRVQQCAMLRGAKGFELQTNGNKVFEPPYAAVRSKEGNRWVVFAWTDCHRTWGNPPCPCLHSDPKFPDCPPGESRAVHGWLSFFEGTDVREEFRRIEATGWRDGRN